MIDEMATWKKTGDGVYMNEDGERMVVTEDGTALPSEISPYEVQQAYDYVVKKGYFGKKNMFQMIDDAIRRCDLVLERKGGHYPTLQIAIDNLLTLKEELEDLTANIMFEKLNRYWRK